jgi:hypothetical protein
MHNYPLEEQHHPRSPYAGRSSHEVCASKQDLASQPCKFAVCESCFMTKKVSKATAGGEHQQPRNLRYHHQHSPKATENAPLIDSERALYLLNCSCKNRVLWQQCLRILFWRQDGVDSNSLIVSYLQHHCHCLSCRVKVKAFHPLSDSSAGDLEKGVH